MSSWASQPYSSRGSKLRWDSASTLIDLYLVTSSPSWLCESRVLFSSCQFTDACHSIPSRLFVPRLGLAFILPYLTSLVRLVLARHGEGRTWIEAAGGLGRDAAFVRKAQSNYPPRWEANDTLYEPRTPFDTSNPRYEMARRDEESVERGR